MAEFSLLVTEGLDIGKSFSIDKDTVFIGRTERNDIVLGDMAVSSQHAKISSVDGIFYFEVIKSTNPTIYNNRTIVENERIPLRSGDEIKLGHTVLRFIASDPNAVVNSDKTQIFTPEKKSWFANVKKELNKAPASDNTKKRGLLFKVGVGFCVFMLLLMFLKIITKGKTKVTIKQDDTVIMLPASDIYGYCNEDKTHPYKIIYGFQAESSRSMLYYSLRKNDWKKSISINLNDFELIYAPMVFGGGEWSEELKLELPSESIRKNGENTVIFHNEKNEKSQGKLVEWGIKDVRIEFFKGECNEKEGKRLYELGEELFSLRENSKSNCFKALRAFDEAISNLEGCQTASDGLLTKAEAQLAVVITEIDDRYNKYMASYMKSVSTDKYNFAKLALESILELIPDRRDKRNIEARKLRKEINKHIPEDKKSK